MPYFLTEQRIEAGQVVKLSGDEAHHMSQVRRTAVGDTVVLQDMAGRRFTCQVEAVAKATVTLKILEEVQAPPEPSVSITLFQAFVAEQALDFVLQKSVELGVSNVVLFSSQYAYLKLTPEIYGKKERRWKKIQQEAAKQCERALVPGLEFAEDSQELQGKLKACNQVLLLDLASTTTITPNLLQQKPLGILVGPEGGFSELEREQFASLPTVCRVTLGSRILKAETAALAALSICRNILP